MSNVMIELGTNYVGTDKTVDSGYTREEWDEMSEEDRWDLIHDKINDFVSVSVLDGDEYLEL